MILYSLLDLVICIPWTGQKKKFYIMFYEHFGPA